MNTRINGVFKVKKVFEGKNNFFITLEEFGVQYPIKVNFAYEKNIFSGVGEDDVIELEADCNMKVFFKDGKSNTIFYIEDYQFKTFKVELKPINEKPV